MKSILYVMLASGIILIIFSIAMVFTTRSQNPFVWIFIAGLCNITIFAWLYAKHVIKPHYIDKTDVEDNKVEE